MSTHSIHLPAVDKHVSIGQYVRAVKIAITNPTVEFKHGLTCWWPCKGDEIRRQFFEGLQDRINNPSKRIPSK